MHLFTLFSHKLTFIKQHKQPEVYNAQKNITKHRTGPRKYKRLFVVPCDLIETYKIVTGKERIETKNFFSFHASKYNTRGHCHKLETKRVKIKGVLQGGHGER